MVPVWFTGSQLPSTVTKQSHKGKVRKKDVYLSDNKLMMKKTLQNRKGRGWEVSDFLSSEDSRDEWLL